MILKVKQTFRDKNDHVTEYHEGSTLEITDEARISDLVKRGLCEYVQEAVADKCEEENSLDADNE